MSIIRHFISFLLDFINFVVNKRIKNEINTNKKIEFKIGHKIKEKIKIKNLVELTVEKILLFPLSIKNTKKEIKNNETKTPYCNQKQLEDTRNLIGSSLNLFFGNKVINIFQEIYHEKKTKLTNNVMKKYGIEGMTINLKNFNKYEKLRKKNFKNKKKLKIMDSIIKNKFINYKNIQAKKIKRKKNIHFEINNKELNS